MSRKFADQFIDPSRRQHVGTIELNPSTVKSSVGFEYASPKDHVDGQHSAKCQGYRTNQNLLHDPKVGMMLEPIHGMNFGYVFDCTEADNGIVA